MFKTALGVAMAGVLLAGPARTQSVWLSRPEAGSIDIEFLKPDLAGADNQTFLSSGTFITGRFVSSRLILVGELPLAHSGFEGVDSQTAIGNPYVGLEVYNPAAAFMAELGLRIPVMNENKTGAARLGAVADADRSEAFASNVWTFTAKFNYLKRSPTNLVLRLRAGPSFFLLTDGANDTEWFLDYGGQLGYDGPAFFVLGGVTGRYFASGDGDLAERTIHHLVGSLGFKVGRIRPGVELRLPLDEDMKDRLDAVIGGTVGIELR